MAEEKGDYLTGELRPIIIFSSRGELRDIRTGRNGSNELRGRNLHYRYISSIMIDFIYFFLQIYRYCSLTTKLCTATGMTWSWHNWCSEICGLNSWEVALQNAFSWKKKIIYIIETDRNLIHCLCYVHMVNDTHCTKIKGILNTTTDTKWTLWTADAE